MEELTFFLGLQVKQTKNDIFINQSKYIKNLFKRFGMENAKPSATPMRSILKLDHNKIKKLVNIKKYRDMIGSLLYLTTSKLDIMFSVCMCARFQSRPKESHLVAIKRIFR